MKNTKIQWCESTINPAMGCDGSNLWPSTKVAAILDKPSTVDGTPTLVFDRETLVAARKRLAGK